MDNNKPTPSQRELERRSKDTIKVFNTTDKDFSFVYDRYRWTVPSRDKDSGFGKGTMHFPRYLAMHYLKVMTDDMLTSEMDEKTKAENERRMTSGNAQMNKWEEALTFQLSLQTNNPELRLKVMKSLWGSVVQEYGIDDIEMDAVAARDTRPLDEQLLDKLEGATPTPPPPSGGIEVPPAKPNPQPLQVAEVDTEPAVVSSGDNFDGEDGAELDMGDKKNEVVNQLTQ